MNSKTINPRVLVSVLAIFCIALSAFVWMRQGLRLDEAQSLWQTSRDMAGVIHVVAKDVHVPLYFLILRLWEFLFGTGEAALRSLSLLFFVASIPVMYALGTRAYSQEVGQYSAILAAVSPFLNWYGSEARMYSMLFLLSALSHYCFILLWKEPSRPLWLLYGALSVLGIATHPFFGFILLSQAAFYLIRRDLFLPGSMRRMGLLFGLVAATGIGWAYYRHVAGAGLSDPALSAPTSVDFFNVFSNFFIGFQTDGINTFFLSLWPVLVFVAFTLLDKKRQAEPETAYLMISSFVPIVLAFIVSVAFMPLFLSRYLIVALPSLYLLSVHFLSTYKPRAARIALGALCGLSLFMLFVQAVDRRAPVKEDYRTAAEYVQANAGSDDLFIVSAPFVTYPVEYYYDGSARLATFPHWDRFDNQSLPEAYEPGLIDKDSQDWQKVYRNVYMLFGYDQGYEEATRVYMDTHYQRVLMKTFSPGLSLYVYRLRYL